MKRSPLVNEEIAREGSSPRHSHYLRSTITVPRPVTRCSASANLPTDNNEEMDIMRLASRNVNSHPATKRTAFHGSKQEEDEEEDKDETSSVDSKRVKVIYPARTSFAYSSASEGSYGHPEDELFSDDASSTNSEFSWKKDSSPSQSKGNHYVHSMIVDYLQTRSLASKFKNPTKEDRMKSSGLANVTKSRMAASVVHLGGKYDRLADSYLRGLRIGLSYAIKRHERQREEQKGKHWSVKREKREGLDKKAVPRDPREVDSQNGKRRGGRQPRLSLSKCREKNGNHVSGIRQHQRDETDDSGKDTASSVMLCTLKELKQLEALGRVCRSRKRWRPRGRSANSGYWKPKGAGKRRRRWEQEGMSRSSSRSRSRKRGSFGPNVPSVTASSTRRRRWKPISERPRKKGGRSRRR